MTQTSEAEPAAIYEQVKPHLELGLSFVPTTVSENYFDWPTLLELFPKAFAGAKTNRDPFLVDVELDRLKHRIAEYFDQSIRHDEIAARYPSIMNTTKNFDPRETRDTLLRRGFPNKNGFIQFAYRPFDTRWLYWEEETRLMDGKRADYKKHVGSENLWMVVQKKMRREWTPAQVITHLGCLHLVESGASCIPTWLVTESINEGRQPNLSERANQYLKKVGGDVEALFHYIIATLHDPEYQAANADALSLDWPRISLNPNPNAFVEISKRGRELSALLNPATPVPGVTKGTLRPDIAAIAKPTTKNGRNMNGDDFILSDLQATEQRGVFNVFLNENAYWKNIPADVWNYQLGGYEVLPKWLSYRKHSVLGRPMRPEEINEFASIARRIAAILQLTRP